MNERPKLSPKDYRFIAGLPENERQLIVAFLRELDARFVDGDEPTGRPRPCFFEELEDDEAEGGDA